MLAIDPAGLSFALAGQGQSQRLGPFTPSKGALRAFGAAAFTLATHPKPRCADSLRMIQRFLRATNLKRQRWAPRRQDCLPNETGAIVCAAAQKRKYFATKQQKSGVKQQKSGVKYAIAKATIYRQRTHG
jgi:hypothetical protein